MSSGKHLPVQITARLSVKQWPQATHLAWQRAEHTGQDMGWVYFQR